ncbi:MAG TPA: phosphatase PAP2 family protein [Streptosporangiaceae bacterium]|nr:phosphatase PAP2 family protein [Streptosporangiaceae bacterium]
MTGLTEEIAEADRGPRWWRRVGMFDQMLFDAVAAARLPGFERVLPRLSKTADHSVLWWGIAGGMAVSGRMRLRRGALRGTVAIAIASPLINVVGKQMFRRARPRVDLVPPIRIRWRLPTSPAFPSGHSASAAAFATGVALEAPAYVALPVAGLAAGVAISRVYTGAHYPGDVLAGAAFGAVAGVLTRVIWPRRYRPAGAVPVTRPGDPESVGTGLVAVVNPNAAGAASIADALRGELPEATIVEVADGADLDAALDKAAPGAKVLAVAGGDGTINAGARAALRHGLPLLTIPAGTLDHFARALGIESAADAVTAYRSGRVVHVDVGRVIERGEPERIFLNTATFGAYTLLAQRRDRLRRRMGTWPALAVAGFRTLRHATPVKVTVDGHPRRVWVGFVGNCRYDSWGALPTWRSRLADGRLDVRLVLSGSRGGKMRAVTGLLLGHLRVVRGYRAWRTSALRLESDDGELWLATDGETKTVASPVTITKHPAALAVFQPD